MTKDESLDAVSDRYATAVQPPRIEPRRDTRAPGAIRRPAQAGAGKPADWRNSPLRPGRTDRDHNDYLGHCLHYQEEITTLGGVAWRRVVRGPCPNCGKAGWSYNPDR